MDDDFRPLDIRKYAVALRKRWWLPVLASLLFGGLGFLGLRATQPTVAMAVVAFPDPDAVVLAAGVEGLRFKLPTVPLLKYQQVLASRAFKDTLDKEFGATLTATTLPEPGLRLQVDSPSSEASGRAMAYVLNDLDVRGNRFLKETLGEVEKLTEQQRKNLVTRDSLLSKEFERVDSSSGLAVALASERISLRSQIASISRNNMLLAEVLSRKKTMTVINIEDPTEAKPQVRSAVPILALSFFGILCGAASIVFLTAVDKRIKTRREIETGSQEQVLAVEYHGDHSPVALALAVRNVAMTLGGSVLLCMVDDDEANGKTGAEPSLANQVQALLSEGALAVADRRISVLQSSFAPETLAVAATVSSTILVVRHGRTRLDDLEVAVRALRGAQLSLSGVALIDVPASESRSAAR